MRSGKIVAALGCVTGLFVLSSGCSSDGEGGNSDELGADAGSGSDGGSGSEGGKNGGTGAAGGKANGAGGGASSSGGKSGGNGGRNAAGNGNPGMGGENAAGNGNGAGGGGVIVHNPLENPAAGPPAGNPDGACAIPAEAAPADVSTPTHVVGDGTAASCTGDAFIDAVALGGVITFDCGADPVTITVNRPAKVVNDASDDVVIDGGGKVTLSGGGTTRILYMNTCDEAQHWTTSHCDNQETPRLTVQNITFADADSRNETEYDGGGAIWARGGRFKAVNTRFFNNVCADEGPDVGGAGIRVFDQFDHLPVYVVNSTFGGAAGYGNVCSNGGGISSIGVSWTIINSLFSYNEAIGNGGNPADDGTPGGGSGGGIYNDGNTMTLSLCGTKLVENTVVQHGQAIFFVTNDHSGDIEITDSVIQNNHGGSWYALPGISMHDDTRNVVTNSTLE